MFFCPLGEKQRQLICNIPSSAGDLLLLGKCLDCYWQQKKCMAPGCEPLAVGRMMDALRPHVHGQCLAGAGGGGFLYILTKAPRQKEALEQILANTEVSCEPPTAAQSTRSIPPHHHTGDVIACGSNALPGTMEVRRDPLLPLAPTCDCLFPGTGQLQHPQHRSGHGWFLCGDCGM